MRTHVVVAVLGVALLLPVTRARAELGTIDNTPGATLLLPYFEVDLNDTTRMTTVFTIVNGGQFGTPPSPTSTAATAAVVHVTLWTDLAIPTIAFDVYLTGFDVQPINLRDVFTGFLPRTASDGQDPSDTISPQGDISQDINFASCNSFLPYPVPALTAQQVTDLRNAHTGKASGLLGGNCGARDLGDNVARGFVTVDHVNACSDLFPPTFPSSPNYFLQFAANQNLLAGDFLFVDPAQNFAQGDALVTIEAAPGISTTFGPGDYSFYGRFVGGNGSDRREPLAARWAVPYQDKSTYGLETDLIVWRDPIINPAPFACGGALPAPFPLGATELIAFDTNENAFVLNPADPPFPVVAMRTRVNGPDLAVSPRAGWLFLNLNSSSPVASSPFTDKSARQAWVMVIRRSEGRFSSGHVATQLDQLFIPPSPTPTVAPTDTPESTEATPETTDTPESTEATPESTEVTSGSTPFIPPPGSGTPPGGGGGPGREEPPPERTGGPPI